MMLGLDNPGRLLLASAVLFLAAGCGGNQVNADTSGESGSTSTSASSSGQEMGSSTGGSTLGASSSTGSDTEFLDRPYGSGSRLTARVLRASGGAEMLQWFWDEELQIECVFAQSPDGIVRCLPRDGAVATESNGGVFGLDSNNHSPDTGADCMVPAVRRSACALDLESGYAYVSSPMCGPGPVVREAYRLFESLDEVGSQSEDDRCEVIPVSEGWLAFSLMAVDQAVFVAAEQVVGGGVRTLVGEDGSWQNLELAVPGGQGCFAASYGADGPCVPSPAGFALTASSDEACRLDDVGGEPIRPEDCAYYPSHAMPIYGDEVLREVAGNLEAAYFLGDDSGSCDPVSGRFFQLADATSLDSLPGILAVDQGSGGVVARFGSFDGFSETVGQGLVDTGTGDDCVTWFDGARRWCLPHRVWLTGSTRFADSDCTQTAFASDLPLPFVGRRGGGEQRCITDRTFYEAEDLEAPVYRESNGDCVVDQDAGVHRYTPGELLPTESVLHELFLEDAAPPG